MALDKPYTLTVRPQKEGGSKCKFTVLTITLTYINFELTENFMVTKTI